MTCISRVVSRADGIRDCSRGYFKSRMKCADLSIEGGGSAVDTEQVWISG